MIALRLLLQVDRRSQPLFELSGETCDGGMGDHSLPQAVQFANDRLDPRQLAQMIQPTLGLMPAGLDGVELCLDLGLFGEKLFPVARFQLAVAFCLAGLVMGIENLIEKPVLGAARRIDAVARHRGPSSAATGL